MEKLLNKKFQWSWYHYVSAFCCLTIVTYLTFVTIAHFNIIQLADRAHEITMMRSVILVYHLSIFFSIFLQVTRAWSQKKLPRILQRQSKVLLWYMIAPYFLFLLLTIPQVAFFLFKDATDSGFFALLNGLFLTSMLYFCSWEILGLRFLQTNDRVQANIPYNFIDDFKHFLEQLAHVTTTHELQHLTSAFFERAFQISAPNTKLYIRDLDGAPARRGHGATNGYIPVIEKMITNNESNSLFCQNLAARGILVRDEIEFDDFYDEKSADAQLIELLNISNASIFLPLYEGQTIAAYIIVQLHARPNRLFTKAEQDEMLVFAQYMNNVIYLLRHRNLQTLIQNEKEFKEELHFKHQEIHHYKESIRSLLKTHTTHKIGIIHYKNRIFTYGNKAAQELLQDGAAHLTNPLYAMPLKKLVLEVKKYGSDRRITVRDPHSNQLIFCAAAGQKISHITILVYYTNITDSFTIPFDTLKDFSAWDYAVYLETTKAGQLINQLVPSSTEGMLHFKIDLLKCAFSKESTLLELPEQDLMPVVHILHHVSLRSVLHQISLAGPEQNQSIATQLFGTAPLFSTPENIESLLAKLSEQGTIFIQNIEFLAPDTQERLLAYLTTGTFRQLRSDRTLMSNVRIIASTNNNLEHLVQQGLFSAKLLKKLKKVGLAMPSLLTISSDELTRLAQQLGEQAVKSKEFDSLIRLNEQETKKIIGQRPTSIREFKERIHRALVNKSIKKGVEQLVTFNTTHLSETPHVAEAISLGKDALKDVSVMNLLWNTFQSQAKIATLLRVNRSSVNRKFKKFNIGNVSA